MNQQPRRAIALTVVGILVLAGLVGGGWWLGQRGDRQPAAPGLATAPPTSAPASGRTAPATPTSRERVGTWQRLPAAPLPASHAYTTVWTGDEMLLLGLVGAGPEPRSRMAYAGAGYNPSTGTWRRLPAIHALQEGNSEGGSRAVWTGSEALLAGLVNGAYDPSTNRWRRLPAMEGGRMDHTAVWTGHQLLVWGGRTLRAGSWTAPAHGLAYDPAGNRWSPLPTSPLRGRAGHVAVWTGTQMLVWGGYPARQTDPQASFTDGAAYTPSPL